MRYFVYAALAVACLFGYLGYAVAEEAGPAARQPNACYPIDQAAGMFEALEKDGFTVTRLAGTQMNGYLVDVGFMDKGTSFAAMGIIIVAKDGPETPNVAIFYLDAAGRVVCAVGGVPFSVHRHAPPSA